MSSILNLEPGNVWKYFKEISDIPRCSKQEGQIREYVKEFARRRNLLFWEDKIGNILIRKPARVDSSSSGDKQLPKVIIQAHLDMVCEKNEEVKHDFSKDPVLLRVEGDYLYAVDTSLGADNGIGVASMLAVLDASDVVHPPLECLFTVDEEAGFSGALGIEPHFLKGKIMLNLDGEDENIYIGCAGSGNTRFGFPFNYKKTSVEGKEKYVIKVFGLKGGHSGIDIHLGRANAIKLLSRALLCLEERFKLDLIKIDGGNKLNAIPREAKAHILIKTADVQELKSGIAMFFKELSDEFKLTEPNLQIKAISLTIESTEEYLIKSNLKNRILKLLSGLPHGVVKMCEQIDVVETSTNLAKIRTKQGEEEKGEVIIRSMSRSCVNAELAGIRDRLKTIGVDAGALVKDGRLYPGWNPDENSKLLNLAKNVYQNLFKEEPSAKIVHAGLECGIIGEKFPGMDMISIGPWIENPHSVGEKVKISSVAKYFNFLKGILTALSK